jgi:hypothetical protein
MWLQVNNFACNRGRIHLPLTGVWVADLSVEPSSSSDSIPLVGDPVIVALQDGAQTFNGTVRRVNNAFETVMMRVVGGGGGLPSSVAPKSYGQGSTFQFIAQDLLGGIGEALSTSVAPGILQTPLAFWSRLGGPAYLALANLVAEASSNWRVLPDGSIWVGTDGFPDTGMTDYEFLSWSPEQLEACFYSDTPTLVPGQTWQSGKVANVEHVIDAHKITSRAWFCDPTFFTESP